MRHYQMLIGIWLCFQMLTGCTGPSVSGTGGQTTNGITASIQYTDGKKGANLPFRVRPSDYLAEISSADTTIYKNGRTDSSGILKVDSLEDGSYIIEVFNNQGLAVAFREETADSGGVVDAGINTLSPTGKVRGYVPMEELNSKTLFVQIYGLERITEVDSQSGAFTFNDLPTGSFNFRLISANSASAPQTINNIQVHSNDTTIVPAFTSWTGSAKLILNTAPAGADITGNVTDFPVLVRLNAGNFNFDQAGANGEDIRFTKAEGSQIPYEIERWDAAKKQADIWVKIDTVYGNNDKQYITMYWGFHGSSSISNGAAVFNTSDGFQGVWHLGETESTIANDATDNHFNGTPSDTAPLSVEGIIGLSRSFDGSSNYLHMTGTAEGKLNFQENGTYTVSAWVYVDTLDNRCHFISGKGNNQYFLKFKTAAPVSDNMVWEFVEYHDKTGWCITNSLDILPSEKNWAYLVGVRQGASQFLYLNGKLIDSTVNESPSTESRKTGEDFSIGRFISMSTDTNEGTCAFKGKIDEVRISNSACSADWIKLCYMNQKSNDELIKW